MTNVGRRKKKLFGHVHLWTRTAWDRHNACTVWIVARPKPGRQYKAVTQPHQNQPHFAICHHLTIPPHQCPA